MSNSSAIAFVSKLLIILIKLFLAVLALILVLVLAVPIGFYGMAMYIEPSLPSVTEIQTAQLSMPLEIYSHDGKLIGKFGNDMSLPIAFEDMPKMIPSCSILASVLRGLGGRLPKYLQMMTHKQGDQPSPCRWLRTIF